MYHVRWDAHQVLQQLSTSTYAPVMIEMCIYHGRDLRYDSNGPRSRILSILGKDGLFEGVLTSDPDPKGRTKSCIRRGLNPNSKIPKSITMTSVDIYNPSIPSIRTYVEFVQMESIAIVRVFIGRGSLCQECLRRIESTPAEPPRSG